MAILFKFGFLLMFIMTFQCDKNEAENHCKNQMSCLAEMSTTIHNLIDTSVCSEEDECRFIALGSKPCGGLWSYLVYSTSIDTTKLTTLVEEYNTLEKRINQECNRISDCMVAMPPQRLECQDNKCIASYE